MSEQTESLRELRFGTELRDQFERLIEGEAAGRRSRARFAGLRRRRWLQLTAGCLCCLIAAVLATVYLHSPHPQAQHVAVRQPFNPDKPFVQGLVPFAAPGGVMGKAPPTVGVELSGLARGLDGTVWAWGDRQPRNSLRRALVENWDGSAWQVLPLPHGCLDVVGLAAPSPRDIWLAVDGSRGEALLHWTAGSGAPTPGSASATRTRPPTPCLPLLPTTSGL